MNVAPNQMDVFTALKVVYEAAHTVSVILVPILGFVVYALRPRLKAFLKEQVSQAVGVGIEKHSHEIVEEVIKKSIPIMRLIADDSNDRLLDKINGTYVRSKEQSIRDANFQREMDHLNSRFDKLAS